MNKLIIGIVLLLLVALTGFSILQKGNNSSPTILQSENKTETLVSPATLPTQSVKNIVPLPTEEDVIRLFFSLINEHRIQEAIQMMSPIAVPDDSTRQAWGVQFNDIKSIQVVVLTPSNQEDWTDNQHVYQVKLDVVVSPESADAPIPYYGWGDNPNLRWIPIEKNSSGQWQIVGIATGP